MPMRRFQPVHPLAPQHFLGRRRGRPGVYTNFQFWSDLYLTLCSLSGARPKHRLAGEDLSPVFAGEKWQRKDPVLSVWGKWEKGVPDSGRVAFSLRSKTHRYSCYWNGGEELYESESDPFEHINLLAHGGAGGNLRALADSYQDQIDRLVPELAEVAGWGG